MGILNIREAEREGARLVIGLAGVSGEGKTYTALQLAWGLANFDSRKVGLLDTENRRGSLYADVLKDRSGKIHRFLIGDLDAPFSPARYKQAILEFQNAGVEVLVIDSASHEWEGTGGCDEIANNTTGRIANWKGAKAEHKSFMNTLLQSDMHIITCIRAREKTDFKDPKNPKSLGIQPIQEKNYLFEMTASLMMQNKGRHQEILKCPAELLPILGRQDGYLTPEDGKALRDWVDGAKQLDPAIERARNMLRTTTEQGLAALGAAWNALPREIKRVLGPTGCPPELKAAAEEFDRQRAAARDGGLDDLNIRLSGTSNTADLPIIAEIKACNDYQAFQAIEERATAEIDAADQAGDQATGDAINNAIQEAHARFAPVLAGAA